MVCLIFFHNSNSIKCFSISFQTNTDNVRNDNSIIIASINLGFPKGIATILNEEIKIIGYADRKIRLICIQ